MKTKAKESEAEVKRPKGFLLQEQIHILNCLEDKVKLSLGAPPIMPVHGGLSQYLRIALAGGFLVEQGLIDIDRKTKEEKHLWVSITPRGREALQFYWEHAHPRNSVKKRG